MYPISKLLHFIWFQGFDFIPDYMREVPTQWKTLNPDYEVLTWDFSSLSEFISKNYPKHYNEWNNLDKVIKKCDYARLLLAYHFGGVYLDCDLIPRRGIESFLSAKVRYCQQTTLVKKLPVPYPQEPYSFKDSEVILSREHRPIDSRGFGIANGIIFAKPHSNFLMEFLERYRSRHSLPVLSYLGPHALTSFIREKGKSLQGKVSVVCPYYFLWEGHAMDESPPPWSISTHLARNHWGDTTKTRWWEV